jgi:hypothetical protein
MSEAGVRYAVAGQQDHAFYVLDFRAVRLILVLGIIPVLDRRGVYPVRPFVGNRWWSVRR